MKLQRLCLLIIFFVGIHASFACPVGQYLDSLYTGQCEPCPVNTYKNNTLNSFSQCLSCPSHSTTIGLTGQISCACRVGYYMTSGSVCSVCPANTFNPNNGAVLASQCLSCPASSTSSSAASYCNCPSGTYWDTSVGFNCSACPAGSYGQIGGGGVGLSSCTLCSPGTYSPPDSASCSMCPTGTFTSQSGAGSCTNCPSGATSGSGSNMCSCPAGQYWSTQASTCVGCPAGTYNKNVGATSVSACLACGPGSYSLSASASCLLCPPNTFNAFSGASACTLCSTLDPSFVAPANGSVSCSLAGAVCLDDDVSESSGTAQVTELTDAASLSFLDVTQSYAISAWFILQRRLNGQVLFSFSPAAGIFNGIMYSSFGVGDFVFILNPQNKRSPVSLFTFSANGNTIVPQLIGTFTFSVSADVHVLQTHSPNWVMLMYNSLLQQFTLTLNAYSSTLSLSSITVASSLRTGALFHAGQLAFSLPGAYHAFIGTAGPWRLYTPGIYLPFPNHPLPVFPLPSTQMLMCLHDYYQCNTSQILQFPPFFDSTVTYYLDSYNASSSSTFPPLTPSLLSYILPTCICPDGMYFVTSSNIQKTSMSNTFANSDSYETSNRNALGGSCVACESGYYCKSGHKHRCAPYLPLSPPGASASSQCTSNALFAANNNNNLLAGNVVLNNAMPDLLNPVAYPSVYHAGRGYWPLHANPHTTTGSSDPGLRLEVFDFNSFDGTLTADNQNIVPKGTSVFVEQSCEMQFYTSVIDNMHSYTQDLESSVSYSMGGEGGAGGSGLSNSANDMAGKGAGGEAGGAGGAGGAGAGGSSAAGAGADAGVAEDAALLAALKPKLMAVKQPSSHSSSSQAFRSEGLPNNPTHRLKSATSHRHNRRLLATAYDAGYVTASGDYADLLSPQEGLPYLGANADGSDYYYGGLPQASSSNPSIPSNAPSAGEITLAALGGMSFQYSTDYERMQSAMEETSVFYTTTKAECTAYVVHLHLNEVQLHPNFYSWVMKNVAAMAANDSYTLHLFVATFGSHFAMQVVMGSRYGMELEINSVYRESTLDTTVTQEAETTVLGLTTTTSNSVSNEASSEFTSNITRQFIYTIGSTPPDDGDAMTWASQTLANPAVIAMHNLQLITLLFNSHYFPTIPPPMLEHAAANLEWTIAHQCPDCTPFLDNYDVCFGGVYSADPNTLTGDYNCPNGWQRSDNLLPSDNMWNVANLYYCYNPSRCGEPISDTVPSAPSPANAQQTSFGGIYVDFKRFVTQGPELISSFTYNGLHSINPRIMTDLDATYIGPTHCHFVDFDCVSQSYSSANMIVGNPDGSPMPETRQIKDVITGDKSYQFPTNPLANNTRNCSAGFTPFFLGIFQSQIFPLQTPYNLKPYDGERHDPFGNPHWLMLHYELSLVICLAAKTIVAQVPIAPDFFTGDDGSVRSASPASVGSYSAFPSSSFGGFYVAPAPGSSDNTIDSAFIPVAGDYYAKDEDSGGDYSPKCKLNPGSTPKCNYQWQAADPRNNVNGNLALVYPGPGVLNPMHMSYAKCPPGYSPRAAFATREANWAPSSYMFDVNSNDPFSEMFSGSSQVVFCLITGRAFYQSQGNTLGGVSIPPQSPTFPTGSSNTTSSNSSSSSNSTSTTTPAPTTTPLPTNSSTNSPGH